MIDFEYFFRLEFAKISLSFFLANSIFFSKLVFFYELFEAFNTHSMYKYSLNNKSEYLITLRHGDPFEICNAALRVPSVKQVILRHLNRRSSAICVWIYAFNRSLDYAL